MRSPVGGDIWSPDGAFVSPPTHPPPHSFNTYSSSSSSARATKMIHLEDWESETTLWRKISASIWTCLLSFPICLLWKFVFASEEFFYFFLGCLVLLIAQPTFIFVISNHFKPSSCLWEATELSRIGIIHFVHSFIVLLAFYPSVDYSFPIVMFSILGAIVRVMEIRRGDGMVYLFPSFHASRLLRFRMAFRPTIRVYLRRITPFVTMGIIILVTCGVWDVFIGIMLVSTLQVLAHDVFWSIMGEPARLDDDEGSRLRLVKDALYRLESRRTSILKGKRGFRRLKMGESVSCSLFERVLLHTLALQLRDKQAWLKELQKEEYAMHGAIHSTTSHPDRFFSSSLLLSSRGGKKKFRVGQDQERENQFFHCVKEQIQLCTSVIHRVVDECVDVCRDRVFYESDMRQEGGEHTPREWKDPRDIRTLERPPVVEIGNGIFEVLDWLECTELFATVMVDFTESCGNSLLVSEALGALVSLEMALERILGIHWHRLLERRIKATPMQTPQERLEFIGIQSWERFRFLIKRLIHNRSDVEMIRCAPDLQTRIELHINDRL